MTANDWLPGARRQQHQAQDQRRRAELCHHRVPLPGHLHLAPPCVVDQDEQQRRDRHQLPEEQEGGHVRGGWDQQQAGHEQREDARCRPAGQTVAFVPEAEHHGADADEARDHDEEGSEAVEGEGEARERHQGGRVHHGRVTRVQDVRADDEAEDAGRDGECARHADAEPSWGGDPDQ